jgi:hypothetical protein
VVVVFAKRLVLAVETIVPFVVRACRRYHLSISNMSLGCTRNRSITISSVIDAR